MKKIYTRLLWAVIVLLPTCFAVLSFMNARTRPIHTSSVLSMELIAPDGTSVKFDANQNADAEFIHFFVELNDHALNVEKLPADLEEASCYKAVYVSRSNTREYRYYFSPTKPSSSYYTDHEGNAFRIDAADTIAFLDSAYSGGLYAHAMPPVLTVHSASENQTLQATRTDWRYYTYSNVEHTIALENETVPIFTTSYASFSMEFDTFPDQSSLTITDDRGETVYTGSYTQFSEENRLKKLIRKDTLLHFELSAHWETNNSLGYGGDADYRFDLQVIFDPAAAFWLGENTVELGDFVVLTGKYVENLDELSFAAEPSIQYTPKFFKDGEYIRALIPISQALPEGAGDYTFTLTYMGIAHTLTLKVKPTDYADTVKDFRYTGLRTSARTEEALEAFSRFIASLPYEESIMFSGSFVINSGENLRAQFGNTVNNTSKKADRFISNGTAFVAYSGTNIYAVNQGKVIAVDETAYGGNTIVIDHGLGLRSVYYCVGKVAVDPGDMVSTGTVIGKGAGKVGYADGITAYCELWVGDVPVSYYPLVEGGRTGMIVYGEDKE